MSHGAHVGVPLCADPLDQWAIVRFTIAETLGILMNTIGGGEKKHMVGYNP